MKQAGAIQLYAQSKPSLFRGIRLEGFSQGNAESIRAMLSRIPPELLKWTKVIISAPELQPKHGRYLPDTETIMLNPHTFTLRQRFGKGQGWIHHSELVVVHEVGHSIFTHLSPEQQDAWLQLTGWVEGDKQGNKEKYVERRPGWPEYVSDWTHKDNKQVPRHYSEKNPDEHFADCFAFYILGKPQQMSPETRAFIKDLITSNVLRYPRALVEGPVKK